MYHGYNRFSVIWYGTPSVAFLGPDEGFTASTRNFVFRDIVVRVLFSIRAGACRRVPPCTARMSGGRKQHVSAP